MSDSFIKVFPSETRGLTKTSWLESHHSFSFSGYQDPSRIRFGFLRVFNDDTVDPNQGFPLHDHENMEIVTVVLEGELEHKDSLGHRSVLKAGDVQRMTAGKGVQHSEMNPSLTEKVHFLQIWIFPQTKNLEPSYEQKHFSWNEYNDQLQVLVSPRPVDNALHIHQEALFSLGCFEEGSTFTFSLEEEENAVFLFVIEGKMELAGHTLSKGYSAEIMEKASFDLVFHAPSKVLFIEMP